MIVPMKHITLLCVEAERKTTLETLRDLGAVHLTLGDSESDAFRQAQSSLASACHVKVLLADIKAGKITPATTVGPHKSSVQESGGQTLLNGPLPEMPEKMEDRIDVLKRLEGMRQALINESERIKSDITRYAPFGDFDIKLPVQLAKEGVAVQLFRAPVNTTFIEREGVLIEEFCADATVTYGVMIGSNELPEGCEPLPLPNASISTLHTRHAATVERLNQVTAILKKEADKPDLLEQEIARLTDLSVFANALDSMETKSVVAWISGWLPIDQVPQLNELAQSHSWGTLLRDPEPEENPPTLLRPPRLFRPVLALFDALGIAPAYSEADVSVPFFCFFSIFFAMLVGDGGYGALILTLTFIARRKMPTASRTPFVLLTCFAVATMIWGFLSNTWFGTHPSFADNPASLWLNHPQNSINNMMLLCFTLGAIHLSIARIWNAVCLFPDSKFLAQIGWVGTILFMYCMSCSIVGIFKAPTFIYPFFAISVLLIFLFTLKRSELKEKGIDLGMMPLTIVSTLGDIISYVRLFAVGLASVKVAENFNDMAINLGLPLWAKIIPMLLILLIGHGLNFAMAGLSILVHAVRLNTLEFSNHKGITWSGYGFRPFKRKADIA